MPGLKMTLFIVAMEFSVKEGRPQRKARVYCLLSPTVSTFPVLLCGEQVFFLLRSYLMCTAENFHFLHQNADLSYTTCAGLATQHLCVTTKSLGSSPSCADLPLPPTRRGPIVYDVCRTPRKFHKESCPLLQLLPPPVLVRPIPLSSSSPFSP